MPAELIVTVGQYEELLVNLDAAHRRAIQRMIKNGMPEPESYPPLDITATIVPDAAALSAVRRESFTEGTPSEQEEIVPEIRTVRRNTDSAKKVDASESRETGSDTGEDSNTTLDTADETGTATDTASSSQTQTDSSNTQENRGDRQTTENKVLV